jgi:TonB family protein
MRQGWNRRKSSFPFILCFISLMHITSMFIKTDKFKDTKISLPSSRDDAIRIQIDPVRFDHKKQIVQSEEGGENLHVRGAYVRYKTRSFSRQKKAETIDLFKKGESGNSINARKVDLKNLKFSDLALPFAQEPFQRPKNNSSQLKIDDGVNNAAKKISSTNDFIPDIPLGDITQLNTIEFKHYGFYHRIRQRLEQFWGRSIQEKAQELSKMGRAPAARDNLITSLQITLDYRGEIVAIKVLGSSGIKELDEAAIESFNHAGPFPNPPKELIVNGRVTLEWGFVIKS